MRVGKTRRLMDHHHTITVSKLGDNDQMWSLLMCISRTYFCYARQCQQWEWSLLPSKQSYISCHSSKQNLKTQLSYTAHHRTVLIILPLSIGTIIIAQVPSIAGESSTATKHVHYLHPERSFRDRHQPSHSGIPTRSFYVEQKCDSFGLTVLERIQQEGQHPLTGQRAANFRRDLEAT